MNTTQIFILIGIILLFIIQYLQINKKNSYKNNNSFKWNNKNASKYFNLYLNKWGYPTKVNLNPNGYALWEFNQPSPWSIIMIKDIPQNFLYFSLPILIPFDTRHKILSISPCINLNNDSLSASGNEQFSIICSLYFCLNILNKLMTLEYVKKTNLLNMSIMKSKKYPILLNKYERQMNEIMNSHNLDKKEKPDTLDYEIDLAKHEKELNESKNISKYVEVNNESNNENDNNGFLPSINTLSQYAFL